jgi:hypothetical protein
VHFFIRGTKHKDAHRLFISIYAYNIIVVILFFYAFQFHYGTHYLWGGTDDVKFEYCGRYGAGTLKSSGTIVIPRADTIPRMDSNPLSVANPEQYERYRGYITVLAVVNYLSNMIAGDMHTLNLRMLNSLAIGLMAVIAFLLAMRCGLSKDLSFIGAFWAGVYPSQAFWGAVIVRDTLVASLVVGAVYCLQRLIFDKSQKRWAWLVIVILLLYSISLLRPQSALLLAGAMGLFILYFIFNKINVVFKSILLGLYGFIAFICFKALFPYIDELNQIIQRKTLYRLGVSEGLSYRVFRFPLVPFGLIIRPLYALVCPFPSIFKLNTQIIFQNIGTITVVIMFPFLFIGFFHCLFDREKSILAIIPSGLLLGVSYVIFEPRYTLIYMPFIFLLIMHGWSCAKRPWKLFTGGLFVFDVLAILYLGLKMLVSLF